jgi:hypothetical protein
MLVSISIVIVWERGHAISAHSPVLDQHDCVLGTVRIWHRACTVEIMPSEEYMTDKKSTLSVSIITLLLLNITLRHITTLRRHIITICRQGGEHSSSTGQVG